MKGLYLLLLLLFCFKINSFCQNLPQIYIHTDRSIYMPGDTIWFKAYLMENLKLDSAKRNLYINWGRVDGNVDQCNVYLAGDGYALSQYVIPADYKEDHILLNAFTGDIALHPELGFYKYIDIVNSNENNLTKAIPTYLVKAKVHGGKLIHHIDNEINLRGEDVLGRPFVFQAELLDSHFETLLTVQSDSTGLASFNFIPSDESYMIRWVKPNGDTQLLNLPTPSSDGVQIKLSQTEEAYFADFKSIGISLGNAIVIGRLNQAIIFEHEVDLSTHNARIQIPKELLHFGLLNLDLFDVSNKQKIASIVEIVEYKDLLIEPKVEILVTSGEKKAMQSIKISLPDTLVANISMSIIDFDNIPDNQDNIISAVLGNKNLPLYDYNKNINHISTWAKTVDWNSNFDLVDRLSIFKDKLLSVKGRVEMSNKKWIAYDKYIEKLVIGKKKSRYLYDPRSLSIGFRPIRDDTINYPFKYDQVLLEKDRTFSYTGFQFFDTMEFKLSHVHRFTQYSEMNVKYNFKPFEDYKKMQVPQIFIDTLQYTSHLDNIKTNNPEFFKAFHRGHHIETVVVARKRKRLEVMEMENRLKVSTFFKNNSIDDYLPQEDPYNQKYSTSIEEVIRNSQKYSTGTITYLNEVRIVTPEDRARLKEALAYDGSWFALLKVISTARRNELALYTFAPHDVNREIGRQIKNDKVVGYSNIAPVVNKVYKPSSANNIPDNRITLYWHPLIQISPQNPNAEINFYNNDLAKGYWIIIKGVTSNGQLIDYKQQVTY